MIWADHGPVAAVSSRAGCLLVASPPSCSLPMFHISGGFLTDFDQGAGGSNVSP